MPADVSKSPPNGQERKLTSEHLNQRVLKMLIIEEIALALDTDTQNP
jgi:hypothetical protein